METLEFKDLIIYALSLGFNGIRFEKFETMGGRGIFTIFNSLIDRQEMYTHGHIDDSRDVSVFLRGFREKQISIKYSEIREVITKCVDEYINMNISKIVVKYLLLDAPKLYIK